LFRRGHFDQKNKPLIGDDADAKRFLGIRPAKNASLPASIPLRMAEAMSIGFLASAIAVFINTPAQPSSMAMAASDAVPTPASTKIGTFGIFNDGQDIIRIADAQTRTDRGSQRHNGYASYIFQSFGGNRVVIGINHDIETIFDQ
jgi:hypothetical protein